MGNCCSDVADVEENKTPLLDAKASEPVQRGATRPERDVSLVQPPDTQLRQQTLPPRKSSGTPSMSPVPTSVTVETQTPEPAPAHPQTATTISTAVAHAANPSAPSSRIDPASLQEIVDRAVEEFIDVTRSAATVALEDPGDLSVVAYRQQLLAVPLAPPPVFVSQPSEPAAPPLAPLVLRPGAESAFHTL